MPRHTDHVPTGEEHTSHLQLKAIVVNVNVIPVLDGETVKIIATKRRTGRQPSKGKGGKQ